MASTHFSALLWTLRSSVVVTRRPPLLILSHVSAPGQSISVSSSSTYHTKCGAFHSLARWATMTIGSLMASR